MLALKGIGIQSMSCACLCDKRHRHYICHAPSSFWVAPADPPVSTNIPTNLVFLLLISMSPKLQAHWEQFSFEKLSQSTVQIIGRGGTVGHMSKASKEASHGQQSHQLYKWTPLFIQRTPCNVRVPLSLPISSLCPLLPLVPTAGF
ncbi:hypothetical protein ACLOJK_001106 [Asimina triloba]